MPIRWKVSTMTLTLRLQTLGLEAAEQVYKVFSCLFFKGFGFTFVIGRLYLFIFFFYLFVCLFIYLTSFS